MAKTTIIKVSKRISKSKNNSISRKKKQSFKVISTWDHGLKANKYAINLLKKGRSSVDALVAGCTITESENGERTVGLGGWPDREGIVTLDAALMKDNGNAGSVAFVRGVAHPTQLARRVMEKTPHVMLVGLGAEEFAR